MAWLDSLPMKLNVDKYEVLNVGIDNEKSQYKLKCAIVQALKHRSNGVEI